MIGAGPAAREHGAASAENAAGSPIRALEQMRAVSAQRWQLAATLGGKWAQRGAAFVRSLVRPRLMRQAVAAARRGNLDAAFALLREEVSERPGVQKSTLLFWGVALACERAPEAAAPMARLVRDEAAAGRVAAALDQWLALVAEVPGAVLDVATLARIVPVLRTRYSEARGESAQQQARERLIDALRRSVDPASGALTVGIALRLVEEARGLDADVARRAAEAALAAPGLHEAKRARLGELLRSLDEGRWPEAPVAAPPVPAAPRPAPPALVPAAPRPAPPAPAPVLPCRGQRRHRLHPCAAHAEAGAAASRARTRLRRRSAPPPPRHPIAPEPSPPVPARLCPIRHPAVSLRDPSPRSPSNDDPIRRSLPNTSRPRRSSPSQRRARCAPSRSPRWSSPQMGSSPGRSGASSARAFTTARSRPSPPPKWPASRKPA